MPCVLALTAIVIPYTTISPQSLLSHTHTHTNIITSDTQDDSATDLVTADSKMWYWNTFSTLAFL